MTRKEKRRCVVGGLLLGAVFMTGALIWKNLPAPAIAPEPVVLEGRVVIDPAEVDLGEVVLEDGVVERSVVVTNTGSGTLELQDISTSCACTSAEMDLAELLPGESRVMKIAFDPNVHPELRGEFLRMVYLKTSDSSQPETEIVLRGQLNSRSDEL